MSVRRSCQAMARRSPSPATATASADRMMIRSVVRSANVLLTPLRASPVSVGVPAKGCRFNRCYVSSLSNIAHLCGCACWWRYPLDNPMRLTVVSNYIRPCAISTSRRPTAAPATARRRRQGDSPVCRGRGHASGMAVVQSPAAPTSSNSTRADGPDRS